MYQPYLDITERLGMPDWWDENGVPRYNEFHPIECADIYARFAALIEIRCQGCNGLFPVAASWGLTHFSIEDVDWSEDGKQCFPKAGLPKDGDAGFCHYGDAPFHPLDGQCSGTTMTTGVVRILQFWRKDFLDWKRDPAHEVYIGERDE